MLPPPPPPPLPPPLLPPLSPPHPPLLPSLLYPVFHPNSRGWWISLRCLQSELYMADRSVPFLLLTPTPILPCVCLTVSLTCPWDGRKVVSLGKTSTKPLYFDIFLRWPEYMIIKILLKCGMWCLIYTINTPDMYLYVYIFVGVCYILDRQQRSKIKENESYVNIISSINLESVHGT